MEQKRLYLSSKTLHFWKGLYKVIEDYVDNYTLEDLVNQEPLVE